MRLRPVKTISITFTAIIIFLAFPSVAILASWNSIPGSPLYPVKRGLEKIALAVLPNSLLEMNLRFKLLDRRTNEASLTIIQQSSERPLSEILTEAKNAKLALNNLNPHSQKKARTNFIAQLNQTNQKLEQIKTTVAPPSSPNTNTPPTQQEESIEEEIEETQEELEEIIRELEERLDRLEEDMLNQPIKEPDQPEEPSTSPILPILTPSEEPIISLPPESPPAAPDQPPDKTSPPPPGQLKKD